MATKVVFVADELWLKEGLGPVSGTRGENSKKPGWNKHFKSNISDTCTILTFRLTTQRPHYVLHQHHTLALDINHKH